jgi:hypothetical protein
LFAEPYVTKALLLKLFGPELASEVAARYFIEGQGPGGFRFRPKYRSEKVGARVMDAYAACQRRCIVHAVVRLKHRQLRW